MEHQPSKLLLKAESLWPINKKEAIDTYKLVLESGSSTVFSAVAAYFLAYYYDYNLSDKDNAITYYTWLTMNHPESAQGMIAQKRLEGLNE